MKPSILPDYQLGDFIKGVTRKSRRQYWLDIPTKFPGSIAARYVEAVKDEQDKDHRLDILDDLIPREPNHDTVMHLRAGDAIRGYRDDKFVWINTWFSYQPVNLVDCCVKLCQEQVKRVRLFCAFHNNSHQTKHTELIVEQTRQIFENHGIEVILSDWYDPDRDLTYMINSKTMIRTCGGFSAFAAHVAKMRGARVFWAQCKNSKLNNPGPHFY
jgi:hypothetical protein